jgi:HNH endonuclease
MSLNAVKRLLRQQAGFGCCKCGRPIYAYHHIIPYADDHHFRPNDMMVLCPYCHSEVEYGLLDEDEQRRYKANPYNIVHGLAQGPLALQQRTIALGSIQFVGDGTFIRVDNHPLLSLSLSGDGRLQVSVELNDRDGNLLALIDKNEWVTGDPYPWDLEYGGRWLLIRRQHGEISLYVDVRPSLVSVRGSLWYKQQHFTITEAGIEFNGLDLQSGQPSIRGSGISNLCLVGAGLLATTEPPSLAITVDPRFKQAMLVSWADVDERVQKGVQA